MTQLAIQDGPDFYIFAAAGDEEPVDVVHSPFSFEDGNFAAAQSAREWFLGSRPDVQICEEGA